MRTPAERVQAAQGWFEQLDRARQGRGRLLDAAGFAPVESAYRVLHAEPGLRLRRYGDASSGKRGSEPALLIVPAPIKRPYIWDLAPEVSVVRRCLDRGMHVYLAEWTEDLPDAGLAEYADRLLQACTQAIAADGGRRPLILAGHSLGGVLATIFSCLHAEQVQALLLLEAPLHFNPKAGDLTALAVSAPDKHAAAPAFDKVPGSLLSAISLAASPHAFQWERMLDFSLSTINPAAMMNHMRVERWTHDESALPGRLFHEVVDCLYRGDQLMQGSLQLGGRTIGPRDVTAALLSVVDPRSRLIPPQSVLPFHAAAGSDAKLLLHYEGDIGVGLQHVGVLVGASAHRRLWPTIFDWLAGQGLMAAHA